MFEEFEKITLGDSGTLNVLEQKMAQNRYNNVGRQPLLTNLSSLRRRNVMTSDPSPAVKANHVISTPIKTMKVMADVGFKNSNGIYVEDERILCIIKVTIYILSSFILHF